MLWNIDSPADMRVGQAVLISHWEFEDGTRGGPGAPVDEGELEPAGRSLEALWSAGRLPDSHYFLHCTVCTSRGQVTRA